MEIIELPQVVIRTIAVGWTASLGTVLLAAGHEHRRAIKQGKGLPVLQLEAEHGARSVHADHVQAQRLVQFLVNLAQHLIGLDHFDPVTVATQHRLAQAVNGARAHAGLAARPEIHAQAVRLPVVECFRQTFP